MIVPSLGKIKHEGMKILISIQSTENLLYEVFIEFHLNEKVLC